MVSVLVLESYDGSTETRINTNASAKALGAKLLQKFAVTKHFHPAAYYSDKFNNA